MRPIDADELIKDRFGNDPVVMAVNNAPTIELEPDFPPGPIQCAAMLIDRSIEYETSGLQQAFGMREKETMSYYSVVDLRQIAEHLLVYCNHAEGGDD